MEKVILTLRFKLNVPADGFLTRNRDAVPAIAATPGLLWKIWVEREHPAEVGGVYLFADRAAAEAYLAGPVVQAVRGNPEVMAIESTVWDIRSDFSAETSAPLPATRKPGQSQTTRAQRGL